jgi:hypothetical protein
LVKAARCPGSPSKKGRRLVDAVELEDVQGADNDEKGGDDAEGGHGSDSRDFVPALAR